MASGNTARGGRHGAGMTRRNVLLSGVLGGSALLAGCIGDGDSSGEDDDNGPVDPNDLDGVHVQGQELRIAADVFGDPPDRWHFIAGINSNQVADGFYDFQPGVWQATHELGLWGRWHNAAYELEPGETFPGLYESIDVEVETITCTIHEDAYWSDGTPVTAYDAYANIAMQRVPVDDGGWFPSPEGNWPTIAVHGVDMPDGPDGKVFVLELTPTDEWVEAGGFAMAPYLMKDAIAGLDPDRGIRFPAHVEPFKSMAEHAIPEFENHEGESLGDIYGMAGLTFTYVDEEHIEASRNGEIPTYGAWQIKEIRGDEGVILEPNEYHRHYDRLNFDEVVIEYSPGDQRTHAALHAGALDFAAVQTPPETVESFPDYYHEANWPAASGYGLSVDHTGPFGDPRVRQAMMFALDSNNIAANVHPTAARPVHTPGWDAWASEAIMDEEWANENLINYEQDLDRAEQLMEEAGYERDSDGVWAKDGERLEAQLATSADAPIFETTVASQLDDFGIELNVQTYDGATFVERFEGAESSDRIESRDEASGDFDIWVDFIGGQLAGQYTNFEGIWWTIMANRWNARAYGLYGHEMTEDILEEYIEVGWVAGQWFHGEGAYVEVPPIGEPDGDPEPFSGLYTIGPYFTGEADPRDPHPSDPYYAPPHEGTHDENAIHYWQQLAWVGNWFLPVIPIVQMETQSFMNTANWYWPHQQDDEMWEYMWDYWGEAFGIFDVVGTSGVVANPNNPKDGTEVVEPDE